MPADMQANIIYTFTGILSVGICNFTIFILMSSNVITNMTSQRKLFSQKSALPSFDTSDPLMQMSLLFHKHNVKGPETSINVC